jgi:hypothetical protein
MTASGVRYEVANTILNKTARATARKPGSRAVRHTDSDIRSSNVLPTASRMAESMILQIEFVAGDGFARRVL